MPGIENQDQVKNAVRDQAGYEHPAANDRSAQANDASAKLLEECGKAVAQSANWLDSNIAKPFVNTLIYEPYNAAANGVNAVGRLAGIKHCLDKHKLESVPEAAPYSAEFVAQQLSSGLAATLPYAMFGGGTGVGLRATGTAFRVRGLAYKVMESEKTAQILGAALYDGLKDTRAGETRQGNAAAGAASFAVYEFMNPISRGLSLKALVPSLFATGALGSMAGVEASSLVNKHQLVSLREASDTCLSGGMMNLLLPGAQRAIGHGINWAHVRVHEQLGLDMALDKTAGLNSKSEQSGTLKQLIDDLGFFPVHLNKPGESGTSADYERKVINVDDPSDLALLGHEAKHLALALSPCTGKVLKTVAVLVENGESDAAWKVYRALRLDHEFACREIELAIKTELFGSHDAAAPDKDTIPQSRTDSGITYEDHWRREFDLAVEENDFSLLRDFAESSGVGLVKANLTSLKRSKDGKNPEMPRRKDLELLLEKYETASANVKQFFNDNAYGLLMICAGVDSKNPDPQLNARFRERLELVLTCAEKNPQDPLLKLLLNRSLGKYPQDLLSDSYRSDLIFPSLREEIREKLGEQESKDFRRGPYSEEQLQAFRKLHEVIERVQAGRDSCGISDLKRLSDLCPGICADREFQKVIIERLSDRLSETDLDWKTLVKRLQQRLETADQFTRIKVVSACTNLADASNVSIDEFRQRMQLVSDCLGPKGAGRPSLDLRVAFDKRLSANELEVYSKLLDNFDRCAIELGKLNLPLKQTVRLRNVIKEELAHINSSDGSFNAARAAQLNDAYEGIKKLSAVDIAREKRIHPNGEKQISIILDLLDEVAKNPDRPVAVAGACRTDADIKALSYYRDLLLQSSTDSLTAEGLFGGHLYQFNTSRAIEHLLSWNKTEKDASLADWVFVPSSHGSAADSVKIDGAFINLKDGRLILIDLKSRPDLAGEANNSALEGLEWGCYIDHGILGLDRQSSRSISEPNWARLNQELMTLLHRRTQPSLVTYFHNGRKIQTTVKLPVYNLADFPDRAGLAGSTPQIWLPSFEHIDPASATASRTSTDAELRELSRFKSLPGNTELARLRRFLADRARLYNYWRSGRTT